MQDTARQYTSGNDVQQFALSESEVEKNIHHIVSGLIEGILVASKKGTIDLDDDAIKFATEKYSGISEEDCKLLFNPVYWYLVLGEKALIDCISVAKIDEATIWSLKKPYYLVNEKIIEDITDEIVGKYHDPLRCKYTGVQTMEEYLEKVRVSCDS